MFYTYEDYLPMEKSLPLEEMKRLHHEMMEEIGTDEDALEFYKALVKQANRYVSFRSAWGLWSREEKMEHDSDRSACHDSLIVKFNQLSRILKLQGKKTSWRDELGYEEDSSYNRKRVGDFACYIVLVNCLNAR